MRRRLVIVSLAVTSMVVIAFALPLGVTVSRLADNLAARDAEQEAQQIARAVATLLDSEDDSEAIARVIGADTGATKAVFLPDLRIGDTVDNEHLDASLEIAWTGQGVSIADDDAHLALVPVFRDSDVPVAVVAVAVSRAFASAGVRGAWAVLAGLSIAMVGLSALLADRLGRSLVRPVEALADGARALAAGDLDTTVPVEGPPEIQEVARGFNRLGGRIRDLLQDEREVIADLSHRLRTPLTALRLEMEGRAAAQSVDDLSRAVDEIIEEARGPQRRHLSHSVDLVTLVTDRAGFWGALAEDEERSHTLEVPGQPLVVEVNPGEYGAAIDALLGNVFSHTPPGTAYSVRLTGNGEESVLLVEDAGPGLPATGDVLARGSSPAGSTGLGLDICVRVARSNDGDFSVVPSSLGGAGFRLRLPIR